MIKLNVVAVGKLKERFFTDAVNEYAKRISRFASLKITEIPEKKTVEEEGTEILKKTSGLTVLTDVKGEAVSSENLAEIIKNACTYGQSEITFIIGSSEGTSEEVKKGVDKRISFGAVTFPHQLMRVILCEQLYRALTIINNVTYHK